MLLLGVAIALLGAEVVCIHPWEKPSRELFKESNDLFVTFRDIPLSNSTIRKISHEKKRGYWNDLASQVIQEKLQRKPNKNIAKNIILFLGDGMSIPTLAATRIYLGGEEKTLSFETFPYTALSKTYCVDHQTADSACSATAYLCGVKANLATIGVTAEVKKENCSAMNDPNNQVESIARLFQQKGKWTGLVTTMRVTHASPAGVFAHTAYRHWESDTDVLNSNRNPKDCHDIATQLIYGETGRNLHVILGGGREKFIPKYVKDEEGFPGDRSSKINLLAEWVKQKQESRSKYEYIWNRSQLLGIKNSTEYILGLFDSDHMDYNLERNNKTDPSLEEMTEVAIKTLQKGPNGFFLFVEGGKIDKGHHATTPHKALDETAEFSKAVQKAIDLTNEEDTLIIVTSDHSHTMSFSGHAKRGADVFGYAGVADDNNFYTTLSYANGPGYRGSKKKMKRFVPTLEDMRDINFKWPSLAPLRSEAHGADDVAVFAKGPWEHLFTGVLEQSVLPHIMAVASCVVNASHCET